MEVSLGVVWGVGMEFGNTLGLTQGGGGTDFFTFSLCWAVREGVGGKSAMGNLDNLLSSFPTQTWDSLQEVEGPQAHRWHCHLHHLFDLLGN